MKVVKQLERIRILLNKIIKKFKNQPVNNNAAVYINKPIELAADDFVGFDVHIAAIKRAISNGASSIGVISDYGTGKSSLTELIGLQDKNFCAPIKINLWDCLTEETNPDRSEASAVKTLTKSFLFQLAAQNTKVARHINKRLSKNYGTLSFSVTSRWFWLWFSFAAILYCAFLTLSLLPNAFQSPQLMNFATNFLWLIELLTYVRPIFLIASIACLLVGLKNTDIAFSLWDSQGKRNPEVNDVFDIYLDIIEKLGKHNRKKKQLIIIEDLDRIEKKPVTTNFLREIYRFNNLLSPKMKKKFVFVVAVKPEVLLDTENTGSEVYPKIFDYTINLKPIHNEDYKSIVLKLLEKNHQVIKDITGVNILDSEFPIEFEWILTGTNLTVRDLKQRLNNGLLIYQSLKGKLHTGTAAVDLKRCMAVSYLESAYPQEYYTLITKENEFSTIVEFTYKIKNDANFINITDTEKEVLVAKKITELCLSDVDQEAPNEFFKLIARLLLRGIIDNDFRMYFYSYPKGSYVKNTDEKLISNFLELPMTAKPDNLNVIIERMGNKADYAIAKSYASLMRRDLPLPKIIFENSKLFSIAAQNHLEETVNLMVGQLKWNAQNIATTKEMFRVINNFEFESKGYLLESYVSQMKPDQVNGLSEGDICKLRVALIESVGESIIFFKELFCGEGMPIISSVEMSSDLCISTKLKLINPKHITDENISYIYEVICAQQLSEADFQIQDAIYQEVTEKELDAKTFANISLNILTVNQKMDVWIFELIVQNCIKDNSPSRQAIAEYLKQLNVKELSLEYLKFIDKLMVEENIAEELLQALVRNNLYNTPLMLFARQGRLSEIDVSNEINYSYIIAATRELNNEHHDVIILFRTYILKNNMSLLPIYKNLFFTDYPLITLDELQMFNDLRTSIDYIAFSNIVTEEQASDFTKHINHLTLSQDDKLLFFELFSDSLTDPVVVAKIFDLIDFNKLDFKNISTSDLETLISNVYDALNLQKADSCLNLMDKMGVLIASLEKVVYADGLQRGTILMEDYVALINKIAFPTTQTTLILKNYEISWGLAEPITTAMLDQGMKMEATVGGILWNKKFEYPNPTIEFERCFDLYCTNEYAFEYMIINTSFLNDIIARQAYLQFPSNITIQHLNPLYNLEQTIDFIKYLFSVLSDTQKQDYLQSFKSLKSKQDSIAFSKFMLEDDNHPFLRNEPLFYRIREKLWEDSPTHKKQFTTARNKLYPKKELDPVLL